MRSPHERPITYVKLFKTHNVFSTQIVYGQSTRQTYEEIMKRNKKKTEIVAKVSSKVVVE